MALQILLVGAGQLGSRHLQALALLQAHTEIFVIEPSPESTLLAEERFYQVQGPAGIQHSLSFHRGLEGIPTSFDVLIVATNADVRRKVITDVLAAADVRFAILEKVLFQNVADFAPVGRLLSDKGVRAWVNCSGRYMPFFRHVRDLLRGENCVLNVEGANWGLACNAIHQIDALSFITANTDTPVLHDMMDAGSIPAKRTGFVEFIGTLVAGIGGSVLSQSSWRDGKAPLRISVTAPSLVANYDMTTFQAVIAGSHTDWKPREQHFPVAYQSHLTNVIVQELLQTGTCALPDYALSAKHHIAMLRAFLAHLKNNGDWNGDAVPIT